MEGLGRGLGDLISFLVVFAFVVFGGFVGAVVALIVSIWVPLGLWSLAVIFGMVALFDVLRRMLFR